MVLISSKHRNVALALLVATALASPSADAFAPMRVPQRTVSTSVVQTGGFVSSLSGRQPSTFIGMQNTNSKRKSTLARTTTTALRMSSEDFDQAKYTESAWSAINALTRAADYYKASTVEPPLLLEILLNPSKHSAGDDGESARRVAEKALSQGGVDVKKLRGDLEAYLAKQPKISGDTQIIMGRTFQRVSDAARSIKMNLGVSERMKEGRKSQSDEMGWNCFTLRHVWSVLC